MRRPRTSEYSHSRERGSQTQSDVATDPTSVDADCDNGAALRGMRGIRRGGEAADCRLAAVARPARRRIIGVAPLTHRTGPLHTHSRCSSPLLLVVHAQPIRVWRA